LNIDEETLSEVKEIIYQEKGRDADIVKLNKIIKDCEITSLSKYFSEKNITEGQEKDDFKWSNAWRIVQAVGAGSIKDRALAVRQEGCDLSAVISSRGKLSIFKTNFDSSSRDPRIRLLFADKYLTYNPGDFWTDIKTAGGVADEGGVKFPKGKKPEALLQRLISMVTKPGDIVLDSFAGSGTTGAVAHKMGRRWIMVELGEHAESHIVPRLKKVIDGQDPSGITENVSWQGGGGYRYFRLAPSLLQKDQWGRDDYSLNIQEASAEPITDGDLNEDDTVEAPKIF